VLLDWLDEPDIRRGIRTLRPDGSWQLHPYPDLAAEVYRTAAALTEAGLRPGEVVNLVLSEPVAFITAFMGTLAAGLTPSPLATPLAFRAAERYTAHLAAVFAAARPGAILTDATLGGFVDTAVATLSDHPRILRSGDLAAADAQPGRSRPVARGADDLALLQFTSGSTGTPKGVRVGWDNLAANVTAIRTWLRWTPQDVFASWLPLYHDMGLIGGMIFPVVTGTDLWLMTPDQFIRSPLRWLECFGRHGATLTTAPSFGYAYTARRVAPERIDGLDFAGWRVAILGAERIDPAAVADFTALTAPRGFRPQALIGAYGLAEATLAVTGSPAGGGSRLVRIKDVALTVGEPVVVRETGTLGADRVGGTGWLTGCGVPVAGTGISVVDEAGAGLPPGTFGEIRFGGTSLTRGYLTAAGAADFDPAGLNTGDAGFLLDGELFVVGRIAESMKIHGAAVHAEDAEAELGGLDGAVDGRYAVAFGTVGTTQLAVVFAEEPLPAEWAARAAERIRILTSRVPQVLVLVGRRGSIARTSSGKPRRRLMWNQLPDAAQHGWSIGHGEIPSALSAGSLSGGGYVDAAR
jgi:acyl-CoA synthetase (AMP-forming)/AMP-acid ligase II